MKFAVAVFLGALLIFGLPGIPALHGVAGVLIGTAVMVAEVKWPKAKPIYVEPVARPKPTTPASAYVLAVIVAAASVLLVVVAWELVLPTASTTGSLGIYLGGLGAGMAIGMVLTARQASEAHNRWLASMHPSSQLDF